MVPKPRSRPRAWSGPTRSSLSACGRFAARIRSRWSSDGGGGPVKDKDRKRNREKRKLARERLRRLRALAKDRQLQAEKQRARDDVPAVLPLTPARPDRRAIPREA